MTELEHWLVGCGVFCRKIDGALLIFDAPRSMVEAHGAAITNEYTDGKLLAKALRARGWAVCSTNNPRIAKQWLASLGYGRRREAPSRPMLRMPQARVYGASKIDLGVVVAAVVAHPAITSRALAELLTTAHGRPIDRKAANRAMIAVGWGANERESFRTGATEGPVLV